MSSHKDQDDEDWVSDGHPDNLDSGDEIEPFTLPKSGSSTLFKLPDPASAIQIYPPGHTFVENFVIVDTDPSIHLVESAIRAESRKTPSESWLNESIWSLFSVMAFDSLSSTQGTTNSWEANLLLVTSMDGLIQNFTKMSYLHENLFRFCPGGTLPAHVLQFILDIRDSKLTAKFSKTPIGAKLTVPKKSPQEVKIAQFGSRIWTRAQSTRSLIMNRINKLWIRANRTKSGEGNNVNSILIGILRLTWPMECIDRAQNNASTYISRLKLENKKNRTETPIPTYEDAYQAAYRKVFPRENVNSWIPDYWISFLLCGLPAGDEGRVVLGAGII